MNFAEEVRASARVIAAERAAGKLKPFHGALVSPSDILLCLVTPVGVTFPSYSNPNPDGAA